MLTIILLTVLANPEPQTYQVTAGQVGSPQTLMTFQVTEPKEIKTKSANMRVLFFTSKSCGPCRVFKSDCQEWMTASGWKFGDDATNHFQFINFDTDVRTVQKYKVQSLPTFILLRNEVEVDRMIGYPRSLPQESRRKIILKFVSGLIER